MKRKLISLLLVLAVLLSALPVQTLAAEETGATITVSRYNKLYAVIDGTPYYINSSGVLENMDGTTAVFAPGTYTLYYGPGGMKEMDKICYSGTVTVSEGATNATVSLSSRRFSGFANSDGSLSDAQLYLAESIYYNTSSFDHVHIRVEGSYVIHVSGKSYTARVSNPSMVIRVNGNQVASYAWTGTTDYEWTYRQNVSRSSYIEVEMTLDLTYTDSSGETVVLEDVTVVYDNVDDLYKYIEAIAICDAIQGLDFTVSVEDLEEVITYYTVVYQWKVYGPNGEEMDLPEGTPFTPSSTTGHAEDSDYIYDTEYVTGTSFYDYENGLLYTFHGWDTYSNSPEFSVDPDAEGMNALDDGDTVAENNSTVTIVDDTYINGYWTVSLLPPAPAYIVIDKVFAGDTDAAAEAQDLWFRIDTGYDGDGDGETELDVDYPQIVAAQQTSTGEYRLPIYQYDTPIVITEYNAEVTGYTRTTAIAVTGENASGAVSGDSVTVTLTPEYEGEYVRLGTVTYTNTYTKNQGEPIFQWPSLTLMKTASDTNQGQDGVVFTLYSDAECTTAVTTVTTANGGLGYLSFADIENIQAGTYYLKETTPAPGYHADPHPVALTLTAGEPVEELRNGEFIQVTAYSLEVAVEEDCAAVYNAALNRLHVYNNPILGSALLTKEVNGLAEADKASMSAVVIVHGPITRDADNAITDIGRTWELVLNAENGWTAELAELSLGEYLIHESLASVHGYTWSGVTYGGLPTEVYNNINSGVFTVEDEQILELTLTNTYEEWTVGDFYIRKVDENGAALVGAVFQIFTMEEGGLAALSEEEFTITATTGADGYAHFTGFTVPEGQETVTYYLRETKAPAGYYLSDTIYQVELKAVTANGKTSYEPKISVQDAQGAWVEAADFDNAADLLTVVNYPVLGKLTLVKTFTDGLVPEGLTSVTLRVRGPGNFTRTVTLNAANNWSATLENLALGTYTVVEQNANVPGYSLSISYQTGEVISAVDAVVTLAEAAPGLSTEATVISATATVTNTYTRNEATYEIPATLTIRKVDGNGAPLAGAVFTLDQLDLAGEVIYSVSFTSNSEGVVVFDLLSGFVVDGESINGTYILSETKAPEGYVGTDTTWTVTVQEDDGELRVELNEQKNVFEGFWDWIVGNVAGEQNTAWTWVDGVLTVKNDKLIDAITVTKVWVASEGVAHPESVEAVLLRNGIPYDTVILNAANGWTHSWTGLTEADTWTVDEKAVPEGYEKTVTNDGYDFTITNTKLFEIIDIRVEKLWVASEGVVHPEAVEAVLYRDGVAYETVTLNAENGWTYVWEELTDEFTWTVDEKAVPEGYEKTVTNDGYDFTITNAKIFEIIEVSVEKIWIGEEGVVHPDSVEAVLYRDGVAYDTVTLSQANGWSHVWQELTDEFTWTVDEPSVPSGYSKKVTQEGYHFTITNLHLDIPRTGDDANLLLWSGMLTLGLLGACYSMFLMLKPRKKEQEA